jgi:raffinose/stachyose/melibiose transport system permease protein
VVTVVAPLWLLVVNSFKTPIEASRLGLSLPTTWHGVENYSAVLVDGHVFRGFLNSVLVVIPSVAITAYLGALAAWVFGRSRSRLATGMYFIFLVALIVPGAVVATIVVLKAIGIYGDLLGLIAIYVAGGLSLAIFLMTGFVKTIPVELEESARIDGASSFQVYFKIVLPLLQPVVITFMLIQLVTLWNDFFWPLFGLRSPMSNTLTLGLFDFANSAGLGGVKWELVFAHVVITSLPMVIVFVVAQRRLVEGVMAGARR